MKQVFKFVPMLAFLLAGFPVLAQKEEKEKKKERYEHFKERNISKTYAASGNSLLIENQFGDVKIIPWDKNEIKVDIHIEASSTDKELAEHTFEKIDVIDKQSGSQISFKTELGKGDGISFKCNNCSNTMEINYEVHMPVSNKLTIDNSFGGIAVPDYNGSLTLISKYGSVTAGKMAKLEKLVVEFGKANLKYLDNSNVTFKYSGVTIENLSGDNTINMEFCSYSRINLDNNLGSLKLNDSYSSVHLRPAAGLGATYSVKTSYGSFVDKTGAIKRTDEPDPYADLNKRYEGKTGSGAAKVTVTSSFGHILIGEGSQADMKPKKTTRT